ncbi:unnamed protein product [Auanema sp. JU1783]|nr:unnamed protein product [Auanema sp. JU1783]
MSPSKAEKKVDVLPANFIFSPDDPFYSGPVTCDLMHIKPASYVAATVEFVVMLIGAIAFYKFYEVNQSLDKWMLVSMLGLLAVSVFTSIILAYGIITEQANLIRTKISFIQIVILILMTLAFVSITAMSVGIEMTNSLFGLFVKVAEMERDFGPLWPFNIGVVAFFTAALAIWMHAIYKGVYDFLLDKDYFSNAPSIELAKSLPREE